MVEQEEDPLRSLLVSRGEVDRKRTAETLKRFGHIDEGSGELVPNALFSALSARHKALVGVLAAKVANLLDVTDTPEITQDELARQIGVPVAKIRPRISELVAEGNVTRAKTGAVFISDGQVPTSVSALEAVPTEMSQRKATTAKKTTKRARKPSRQRSGENESSKSESDKQATKKATKRSGPGQATYIRNLVHDGFFDQARTLNEIISRLQDKYGRRYKTGNVSPVLNRLLRAGELDRTKNDQGYYEYHKPGD